LPVLQPMPTDPRGPGPRPVGDRALSRIRPGARFAGVPVAAIVVVELVVAAVLLGPDVSTGRQVAVLAAALVVAVAATLPVRGRRVGTWLGDALAYAVRRHTFTSRAPSTGRGPDGGRGRSVDEPASVPVPPEVLAFFPDLAVLRSTSRSSAEIGLVQWRGRWLAVIAIEPPARDVLSTSPPTPVPVDRLLAALSGHGFGLEAVQVLSQSLYGDISRFGPGGLARVAEELAAVAPLARGRETWLAVRVDPVAAASAIEVRGGGFTGLGRLAATALSRIESEARAAGLVARPLDADAAVRAMGAALLQPAGNLDQPPRWRESWDSIASDGAHHRCFAVGSWPDRTLDRVTIGTGFAVTIAHEAHNLDDGHLRVVSVLRLTAATREQLDQGSRQLRASCHLLGVSIRPLRGHQASALRMTVPAGQR
jgi:type VII secretion protein EccE